MLVGGNIKQRVSSEREMERDWMQEPTTEVQHAGEEHPIEATMQKGRLRRSSGRLKDSSPLSWQLHRRSVPGLRVARWPGNENMTHGKHGQHELARVYDIVLMLVLRVRMCQQRGERWYQMGHRAMQSQTTYAGTKSSGTKPIYRLLLNSLNWHSEFMPE